jgi:opacity protein-like surface antigen
MRGVLASTFALVLVSGTCLAQTPPSSTGSVGYPAAPAAVLSRLGPYVTGQVGGSFPTRDPFTDNMTIGGGVGMRFTPTWRADLSFTYRHDLGPDVSNWTTMLNGYYDFNTYQLQGFVPYLKAGIGIAENSVGDRTVIVSGTTTSHLFGSDKTQFAWDIGAGLAYALNDHTALDIDYQYIQMGSTNNQSTGGGGIVIPTSGNLRAHEVKVGLRWGF